MATPKQSNFENNKVSSQSFDKERLELLQQLDELTQIPFGFLSLVWLGLVVIDFIYGFSPVLESIFYLVWGFFVIHFIIELLLAPSKKDYLKSHMLTVISLFIPTFRILRLFSSLRILRAARAIRSINLVQIVTSLNRGMKSLRSTWGGQKLIYITLLTFFIVILGSAAIYHFENPQSLAESGYQVSETGIQSYGDALWFTVMIVVTIGSEYWPKSVEGRILTFIIALYSFGIFGFITATMASFIIGKDYQNNKKPRA